ncbi:MAG TPA: hypothetical protein PK990_07760 [Salinivirgaceae bacterium]|nr:hypothetical protein [Salinivirgaceae bacterium]
MDKYPATQKLIFFVLRFFAVAILIGSCSRNKFDISPKETISIEIVRLDTAMFEPKPEKVKQTILQYFELYPDVFEIYTERILRLGNPQSRYFMEYLDLFLRHPDIRDSYDSVKAIFGDFSKHKKVLERAFSLVKTHVPDVKIPKIYLTISGFNESLVMADDAVIVGLDKFLGSKSFFYQKIGMPRYLRQRAQPDLLAVEIVRNWLITEYPNQDSVYDLVSEIIQHGKVLYLMDAAFPKLSDAVKISFSDDEITWAINSERHIWTYWIQEKMLFNKSPMEIKKYTGDAPFVATFGNDSPGRIGAWMGWQIVRSFMKHNSDISIEQLMKIKDNHQILQKSKYLPR